MSVLHLEMERKNLPFQIFSTLHLVILKKYSVSSIHALIKSYIFILCFIIWYQFDSFQTQAISWLHFATLLLFPPEIEKYMKKEKP